MFRTWHRVVADVPWGLILGDKIPIKECLQLGVLMSIAVNAHELRKRLFLGDETRRLRRVHRSSLMGSSEYCGTTECRNRVRAAGRASRLRTQTRPGLRFPACSSCQ